MTKTASMRAKSGQALVELGIVILLLMSIVLGIVEFGRMLMIVNMITHATRDGARLAATTPRCSNTGTLSGSAITGIQAAVTAELTGVGVTPDAVNVTPGTAGGFDTITVQTQATIEWSFLPMLAGTSFPVDRQVTFRAESTLSPGAC